MHESKELHRRSIVKAITWRMLATATTMTLIYLFTGDVLLTLGIGSVEIVAKIIIYYIHERAWGRIKWGRMLRD
jgi:uncharacterized membrane protein